MRGRVPGSGRGAGRPAVAEDVARAEAGDFVPVDGPEAAERLTEIVSLAEEVPGDFARVRAAAR